MKDLFSLYCCLPLLILLTGCYGFGDKTTTIEIKDNYRHYYPILSGQELNIMFEIKNTGTHPLILTDILTSCGCLTYHKSSAKSIPSGKTGRLILKYDSSKNIGYVEHYITLYGNFTASESREIVFDVNVVPDALYTRDYEELYQSKKNRQGNLKDLVDGDEHQKGYFISIEKDIIKE